MMVNSVTNPFIIGDPVLPPHFAGRRQEIGFINAALLTGKNNIVIYGIDAIGKSSIIRTSFQHINSQRGDGKVLTVGINATDFVNGLENNFPNIITHGICCVIWTVLMKRPFSELIEATLNFGQLSISDVNHLNEERTLMRIFRIVTSEKLSGVTRTSKEVGGKFLFEGKIQSQTEFFNDRKPLEPFEFLALLNELLDIISSYGYSSIAVFCDELNHLPQNQNLELFRNYLDIFTSNRIQFVIVSRNPSDYEADRDFFDAFRNQISIDAFPSALVVRELVTNVMQHTNAPLDFNNDVFDTLYKLTNGHPWWIQKILRFTFDRAVAQKISLVNEQIIFEEFEALREEYRFYLELTEKGKPYRKSYIRYKI